MLLIIHNASRNLQSETLRNGLLLTELQPKQICIYSTASGNVIKLLCDPDWITVEGFRQLNPEIVQKASSTDSTWLQSTHESLAESEIHRCYTSSGFRKKMYSIFFTIAASF